MNPQVAVVFVLCFRAGGEAALMFGASTALDALGGTLLRDRVVDGRQLGSVGRGAREQFERRAAGT